jgi:membrane associated rhomboid family serine protease
VHFCWYCICIGYSILNLSAPIVGASAAIMGILVAVTTYQPLMNVTITYWECKIMAYYGSSTYT